MAGTFNWNYAVFIKRIDNFEIWYDPINETEHIIELNDDRNMWGLYV